MGWDSWIEGGFEWVDSGWVGCGWIVGGSGGWIEIGLG